ncbi:MAG TPA: glycoside hydrolase family 130 protein [Paludibacteraceae bacterium]|nr:glycoside hydrolase family 130 protein [Paludibacteraceae bacterium]HOK99935.1 glycoside hydrolase family 130 protein [Paludibacteraceae bacterium]HPO66730.1 glycoside hydrolase family 130 protein [Paludibacteraceae bacterium]
MKQLKIKSIVFGIFVFLFTSCNISRNEYQPSFPLGEFIRPTGINPVLSPDTTSVFFCPMNQKLVHWEESDVFNPGAVVKDGKIFILYRAEDNSSVGIASRVSRIGLAKTSDGFTMKKKPAPVVFPDNDNNKLYEWPGGCEDPRVSVTEDGTFVLFYTSWDRKVARLCVATSKDLIHWEKHGPVFANAYNGRFLNHWSKASSILTTLKNGKLVIKKIDGKYFMYWGEYVIYGATSDDLKNWTPVLDEKNELKVLMSPRKGYFDSDLTECGPPCIWTKNGIILLYNGKNKQGEGDDNYVTNAYCAGQALFDANDPTKLIKRLDKPFLVPQEDFEKSGQYPFGTVFIEGLVYHNQKWYLYYGCADSRVSVTIYDPFSKNKK